MPEQKKPWPATFGLRAFPGHTFRVNHLYSYDDQIVIDIQTPDGWQNFTRGTEEEVRRELI